MKCDISKFLPFSAVVCVALAVSAFALCVLPQHAYATFPGNNGKILYKKLSDLNYYFSNADGSNEQATNWQNQNNMAYVSFSPNGTKVIYQGGNPEPWLSSNISLMNIDGSKLIHNGYWLHPLGWDRDGMRYFSTTCGQGDCNRYIYRDDFDSTNNSLVKYPHSYNSFSSLSPKGNLIAGIITDHDANSSKLVTYSTNGNAAVQIIASRNDYGLGSFSGGSTWSPDGSKIATWTRGSTNHTINLEILDATDGSNVLTHTFEGYPTRPIWAPDGNSILFAADTDTSLGYHTQVSANSKLIKLNLQDDTESILRDDVVTAEDWQAIPDGSTKPVYRFWSDEYKHHFYTSDYEEAFDVVVNYDNKTWKYENEAYKTPSCGTPNSQPVYRFWSDEYKGHFFTSDESEKDYVIAHYPARTWKYESIAYYVNE